MPIGLVDNTEFEKELSDLQGANTRVAQVEIVQKPSKGRSDGDNNVPDSLRKVISEEHLLNGRSSALSLASQFGVSSSSVSAYAKGSTSTASYNSPTASIISHINKSRKRAITRASKTLNSALESITQEKLDYADAKDLSSIAKDMSAIIKNLEPQSESVGDAKQTPQFIIYAPQFKKEESFEVITVNE